MTTVIIRTIDEIIVQVDRSYEDTGGYVNLTYEEGVRHALDWITGDSDEPPFEDESDEESDESGEEDDS